MPSLVHSSHSERTPQHILHRLWPPMPAITLYQRHLCFAFSFFVPHNPKLSLNIPSPSQQRSRKSRASIQFQCSANYGNRAFWVLPQSKQALTTALEGNIYDFLFIDHRNMEEWSSLGRFSPHYVDSEGTFDDGVLAQIKSADDVTRLMQMAGTNGIIIMDSVDWKIIPAENLIAAFQNTPTKLFAIVDSIEDAKSMFGMLEIGVDGCVLRTGSELQVSAFASLKRQLVDHAGQSVPNITHAKVTSVRLVGTGERVCIDTCSLLREDEGLLVGSSSQATFLVLSEAGKFAYVASRPFRINAGPVHSYCLVPGGKTRYLAELSAGDEVLVVGNGGKTSRTAVVGRAKIETRPLILIEAEIEQTGKSCTVFVQNAETVRLAVVNDNDDVAAKSVTQMQNGDRVLLKTDEKARHIGLAIDEDLLEK